MTEPKEAPYVTTGNNLNLLALTTPEPQAGFTFKAITVIFNVTPIRIMQEGTTFGMLIIF